MSDITGAGQAASGIASAAASVAAANAAASASKHAADQAQQRYETTRSDLLPYNVAGQALTPWLIDAATKGPTGGGPDYLAQAAGMQPGQMTQAELEATPGYQFNLAQGLKATQNAAAARGLGVSGAALKGAAKYATGLADSTYQNQFNNAQTRFQNALALNTGQQGNLQNNYNRLSGVTTLGENAAAQTGTAGTALANTAAAATQAAGTAQGAGIAGVGNALSGAYNNYQGIQAFNRYTDAISGGTPGYPAGNVLSAPSMNAGIISSGTGGWSAAAA